MKRGIIPNDEENEYAQEEAVPLSGETSPQEGSDEECDDRKVMKDVDSASAFSAGGVHRSLPLSRPLHTSHVPTMPPLPVILSFGRWPSSLSSLQRRSSHGSSLRSSHGQPTSHSLSGS